MINLDAIYAQRREEIRQADQSSREELIRRVEEDKKIQEAEMSKEKEGTVESDDGKGADKE